MTEDQAKTKRCCGPEGCGDYIHKDTSQERYCIGSQCMAWRSTIDAADATTQKEYVELDLLYPGPETISGYCGLAGKP